MLVAPFVIIYGVLFIYPTLQMVQLELHRRAADRRRANGSASTTTSGCLDDRLFWTAVWNTGYFVLLTVVPGTLLGARHRARGQPPQGLAAERHPGAFFLPYVLPVSVVYRSGTGCSTWQFGIAQYAHRAVHGGQHVTVFRTLPLFMPAVALITVWWTASASTCCCSSPGCATSRPRSTRPRRSTAPPAGTQFRAHHLAADLAGDRAGAYHPADPAAQDLRPGLSVRAGRPHRRRRWCWCSTSIEQAFQKNQGGYGAADRGRAVRAIVVAFSVLQFQLLRARGEK